MVFGFVESVSKPRSSGDRRESDLNIAFPFDRFSK